MADGKWVQVRVKATTHAALVELGKVFAEGRFHRLKVGIWFDGVGLSLDRTIAELVKRDRAHKGRAKLQKQRRKAGKGAVRDGEGAECRGRREDETL